MTDAGENDDPSLASVLEPRLGEQVIGTELLDEGLNRMVAVEATGDPGRYVLRQPNKLRDTSLFVSLDAEYQVLKHLDSTPVPTPEPVLYCSDQTILGDPFFLMAHLDGTTVALGSTLPEQFQTATGRKTFAATVVETLAQIHAVDPTPVESCCEQQSPREQIDRGMKRLDAVEEATEFDPANLRSVGERIRTRLPTQHDRVLVHGDYRPSNVLFTGKSQPAVSGVLDWETAMIGDPMTELGYLLLRWCDEEDPTPSTDVLWDRYDDESVLAEIDRMNHRGLAPYSSNPGFPSPTAVLEQYEEATGTAINHGLLPVYRAHAAFMLGTVWADLHRFAVEAGEESDREPYVDYAALLAECFVDKINQ